LSAIHDSAQLRFLDIDHMAHVDVLQENRDVDRNAYVQVLDSHNEMEIGRQDGRRYSIAFAYRPIPGEISTIGPSCPEEQMP